MHPFEPRPPVGPITFEHPSEPASPSVWRGALSTIAAWGPLIVMGLGALVGEIGKIFGTNIR